MYNLVLAACFKNESHILEEWLNHYIHRGVEHFILINDNSTDNYLPIIQSFTNKITLINNNIIDNLPNRQARIYTEYLTSFLDRSKWMLICDLDEFIYSPLATEIPELMDFKVILSRYNQFSEIRVNMVVFGSSGHITSPEGGIVNNFTRRAPFGFSTLAPQPPPYGMMLCTTDAPKTFFQCKDLVNFAVHGHHMNGTSINLSWESGMNIFLNNHYILQSYEWFMNIKHKRGDLDNYFSDGRNELYFKCWDNNEIEDINLKKQNKILND